MTILMGRLILLLLKFPGKKVCNKILGTLKLCKPSLGVPFNPSQIYQPGICNIGVCVCGAIFNFFFVTVKVPVFVYVRTLTCITSLITSEDKIELKCEGKKIGHSMYAVTG